jgi:Iron-containing redox enzyme
MMIASLEQIENDLRKMFRSEVVDPGIEDSTRFLKRWSHLSSQVPRLHGAALARVRIPDIQALLAEIAHGECGSGDRAQIHSKLLSALISESPVSNSILNGSDPDLIALFEDTVDTVCAMGQDGAIGFIVGLEAPAYDILKLLQKALVDVQIPTDIVSSSEYMVIHEAVEKEHQDSGHEAMEIVLSNGCSLAQIAKGGECAVKFLIEMVGEKPELSQLLQNQVKASKVGHSIIEETALMASRSKVEAFAD